MTEPITEHTNRSFGIYCIAAISAFTMAALVIPAGAADAAPVAVGLGNATSFAVLAGAGITNTGPTTLNGNIGTYPTPTVTGAAMLTLTGTNHAGNDVSRGAKPDALIAYVTLAGQGPTTPTGADLTGRTLVSGVYNSGSSIALSGTVTLDAKGDPNAVFVFQAGSTLITSSSSTVALINGAQACNIFWQVGSSATLGTNSVFRGNLLAHTSITATTQATVEGRLIAIDGAVTLDTNTVTAPTCAPPVTTTTTTSAASPTTTSEAIPSEATTSEATTSVAASGEATTSVATPSETTTTATAPTTATTTQSLPAVTTRNNDLPPILLIPALPGTAPLAPGTSVGTSPLAPNTSVPGVPTTSAHRMTTSLSVPGAPESSDIRTSQVRQIPRGSVDTGDGSTRSTHTNASERAWIPLVLTFLAAAVLAVRRTSR